MRDQIFARFSLNYMQIHALHGSFPSHFLSCATDRRLTCKQEHVTKAENKFDNTSSWYASFRLQELPVNGI